MVHRKRWVSSGLGSLKVAVKLRLSPTSAARSGPMLTSCGATLRTVIEVAALDDSVSSSVTVMSTGIRSKGVAVGSSSR